MVQTHTHTPTFTSRHEAIVFCMFVLKLVGGVCVIQQITSLLVRVSPWAARHKHGKRLWHDQKPGVWYRKRKRGIKRWEDAGVGTTHTHTHIQSFQTALTSRQRTQKRSESRTVLFLSFIRSDLKNGHEERKQRFLSDNCCAASLKCSYHAFFPDILFHAVCNRDECKRSAKF